MKKEKESKQKKQNIQAQAAALPEDKKPEEKPQVRDFYPKHNPQNVR
ncbi:MAG: hypothetical protein II328_03280 [Clostridia bacterium]|nr:hypothetical protein [Clostridia bacterium]